MPYILLLVEKGKEPDGVISDRPFGTRPQDTAMVSDGTVLNWWR